MGIPGATNTTVGLLHAVRPGGVARTVTITNSVGPVEQLVTTALKEQHHDMLVLKGFVNELADSHYDEDHEEEAAPPRSRRRGAPAAKPKPRKRRPVMPDFHGSVIKEIRHPEALEMNDRELADSIAAIEAEDEADEAAMEDDIRRELQQMMEEGPPEGLPDGPPERPF